MAVFQNNIPEFEHLDGIDVKFAESCVGFGGYHYVFLTTETKIRPNQLEDAINTYNQHIPQSKAAVLTLIPTYEKIIKFEKKSGKYTKHALYKIIFEEKTKRRNQLPSTYRVWNINSPRSNTFPSSSTSLGKRHAIGSPRELGVHTTPSPAAVAKCSRTDEEIAAIIAEKDREIELLRSEKDKEIDRLQSQLICQELGAKTLEKMDQLYEKMDQMHAEVQTVKKTNEQFDAQEAKYNDLQTQHEHDREVIASDAAKRGHLAREKNAMAKELEKRSNTEQIIGEAVQQLVAVFHEHAQQQALPQTTFVDSAIMLNMATVLGYSQFPDFVKTIIDFQLSTKPHYTGHRQNLDVIPFSLDTFWRYWNILQPVAREKLANCTESVDKLRFVLGIINAPICAEKMFKRLQNTLVDQVKHLCIKNQIDIHDDLYLEYSPVDDPFSLPEVQCFLDDLNL
jgi:hypothetical protein